MRGHGGNLISTVTGTDHSPPPLTGTRDNPIPLYNGVYGVPALLSAQLVTHPHTQGVFALCAAMHHTPHVTKLDAEPNNTYHPDR